MAAELPYMRLWVGDLLGDPRVLAMTPEEFGVFMKLLCFAWLEEGIPSEHDELRRRLGLTPKPFKRIWKRIAPLWDSDGNGRLFNARQERERKEAKRLSQKRAKAGAAGARARWGDG